MKLKFVQALLNIAVALSLFEWNNKHEPEENSFVSYLPSNILQGQADYSSILRPTHGPTISSKEDENIIDSIINWEDGQRRFSRFRQNTDQVAYPIVSQNPTFQNTELSPPSNSVVSSGSDGTEEYPSTNLGQLSPAPPSIWPPSPSSSFEDGELFGAVGYTPQNSAQYFDIESFLNGSFASPASSASSQFQEAANGDLAASIDWMDRSAVQSESVEELAQFLQASIDSPESDEFIQNQKDGFSPVVQDGKNYLHESLEDVYKENKQGFPLFSPFSDIPVGNRKRLSNIDDILDDFYGPSQEKTKGSHFATIESYRDLKKKDEPLLYTKNIKKEISSPFKDDYHFEEQGKTVSFDPGMQDYTKKQVKDNVQSIDKEADCKKIWTDLPYTKDDIIEMEIEKFNSLMSSLDPLQQHVGKDIRRRGKNKLAARNCRKRKVEAVGYLEKLVENTESQREEFQKEKRMLEEETAEIKRKTAFLYDHIFKNLRDERGQPYSHDEYALTYTAEGSVYLVPKNQQSKEEIHVR